MENGKNLEWSKTMSYQEMNWKWSANSTLSIIDTHFTYLAPVPQRQ